MSTVERRPTEPEPLTRADVLTATEASALLGIPRSTLYDLARRQELPARQIGRRWIFRNPCSTGQLCLSLRRTRGRDLRLKTRRLAGQTEPNSCPRKLPANFATHRYKVKTHD
jgi:excisionase family DNA binding protein